MSRPLKASDLSIDFISACCNFYENSLVSVFSKLEESLMDLFCKLTSRSKNEALNFFIFRGNFSEQGETKSGSFTSSSLSLRNEIMPTIEKVGNRL